MQAAVSLNVVIVKPVSPVFFIDCFTLMVSFGLLSRILTWNGLSGHWHLFVLVSSFYRIFALHSTWLQASKLSMCKWLQRLTNFVGPGKYLRMRLYFPSAESRLASETGRWFLYSPLWWQWCLSQFLAPVQWLAGWLHDPAVSMATVFGHVLD